MTLTLGTPCIYYQCTVLSEFPSNFRIPKLVCLSVSFYAKITPRPATGCTTWANKACRILLSLPHLALVTRHIHFCRSYVAHTQHWPLESFPCMRRHHSQTSIELSLNVSELESGKKTTQNCAKVKVRVKVKFSIEQTTKAQRGSRCIALLFL